MTRTQGGPPPCKDEDSPTDNQDRLSGGRNGPKEGQMSCAAYTSNMQSTSNTKKDTFQDSSGDTTETTDHATKLRGCCLVRRQGENL